MKDELKFDIYDANTEIDKYIEQIAQDFILSSLVTNQTSQARVMEAQLSNLQLQKKQQIAELHGKVFDGADPKTTYEKVQEIMDIKIDLSRGESKIMESAIEQYENMKPSELTELKSIAVEYEKLMFLKHMLEKEVEQRDPARY